jgi:hypothetical protein
MNRTIQASQDMAKGWNNAAAIKSEQYLNLANERSLLLRITFVETLSEVIRNLTLDSCDTNL